MITNPDHEVIKEMARALLFQLEACPDGLQKVCNDILPIARFCNGFTTPNQRRPNAVYVELDGETWRFHRDRKTWRRV